jgi:thiol-disulfide isomerase/thioredoxin
MKNITLALVIIILVAGFGFYFFSQQNKQSESIMQGSPSTPAVGITEDSRYIEYSNEILDKNTNKRRVLFFYANWCPTCRPADVDFRENSGKIPEDVVVIRVNYNDTDTDADEKSLAEAYGITYQHTFVQIDQNGNEVAKWNGGQIDELLTKIK